MKYGLTFLLTLFISLSSQAQNIYFTKDDLQKELDRYLPVTEQQDFFSLTVANSTLDLLEDQQRLSIHSQVVINTVFGTVHKGRMRVDGKLRYQQSNHSFYVDEPRITEFHFADLPAFVKPQVQSFVEGLLATAVTDYPLYTLTEKSFEESMAKMMLKSIKIKEDSVIAALSPF